MGCRWRLKLIVVPAFIKAASALRKYVGVLSKSVFIEESSLNCVAFVCIVIVLHGSGDVVDGLENLWWV